MISLKVKRLERRQNFYRSDCEQNFCADADIYDGSIIEASLFLIIINDLPNDINSQFGSYTVDTNFTPVSIVSPISSIKANR